MGCPSVIKHLVLLRKVDALKSTPRLAHHEPIVNPASVLNSQYVMPTAFSERLDVLQWNHICVQVYSSIFVQLCGANEVGLMLDFEDLSAGGGVCWNGHLAVLHIGNGQCPTRGIVSVSFGVLPLLGSGIGMKVDGVWVEVETGRIYRDEDFEVDREMVATIEQPDIVGDVGDWSFGRLRLDNRNNAWNAARLMCRHNTSPPKESQLYSPDIVNKKKNEKENYTQRNQNVSPSQPRPRYCEPVGGFGVIHSDDRKKTTCCWAKQEALEADVCRNIQDRTRLTKERQRGPTEMMIKLPG